MQRHWPAWPGLTSAAITGSLFGKMFVVDRLALFFKVFIVGATILVILLSIDYVHRFSFFRGEYYFLVAMSALGMMFMASANDLLSLFITFEFRPLAFICWSLLAGRYGVQRGGLKFFILGVFAAGLLAYGISLVYGETGKLVFSDMAERLRHRTHHRLPPHICGAGFQDRRRSVPFMDSRYLPRVHQPP